MKKIIQILTLLTFSISWAQINYSSNWEDFYSYNNVKDFIKIDNVLYAIADNAIFSYNIDTEETEKISSINGLSGESISSFYYSEATNKIIVGYATGMLEIIDQNQNITIAKDIVNFSYSGDKSINAITEYNGKLYLSTSFAIIEYNIQSLNFGDTFFIGSGSSEILINEIKVLDSSIYAATENGIFVADVTNPNLIDYNNWKVYSSGDFKTLEVFNEKIYASKDKSLYTLENEVLTLIHSFSKNIISLKSSSNILAVSTERSAYFLDNSNIEVFNYTSNSTDDYYFELNTSFLEEENIYFATQEYGILKTNISNTSNLIEIHPEGPLSNDAFSIEAQDSQLWVVFGLYDQTYTPGNGKYGFSHFTGENWKNKPYKDFGVKNLVHITYDYENVNKVYLSSWGASNPNDVLNTGGMLIVEDDEIVDFWNYTNSGLENIFLPQYPTYITTRIKGSTFDSNGNLWITNSGLDNNLKKYNNTWDEFNLNSVMISGGSELIEIDTDKSNTVWISTRKNGVVVFNETGNKLIRFSIENTKGSLPDLNTRAIKVDANDRVWIGTSKGLVTYNNASNIFNETIYDAEPIIILENGVATKLLGDQVINTIAIDGANNKWFGTSSSGVMQTNPDGTSTLQQFNTSNSPLPSNNIIKISVDKSSGKVYFATDKGIVAYNSNVATYSDSLTEVYAYPNPSTKTNEFITIDGRNGEHLPNGTNVKILDSAGHLVYETNVKEGDEIYGGKVVWNKTNLAGRKVASGVYIVLLIANNNTETTTTKIAIIN
ncbi:T9SS type A sorting domain-containing protein [Lutibacter sp. TH_r2]|uniref:type IX secretion system anionic LPS delivery protein PorZ n=1 Tax=Lutibacter sp. TH_r2 TaxID=3082083 RepID=UPI002952E40F|nr:T9SS type A sorting domain-containing protein [Lutibacter sp. TH_r2]MDV7186514.1 T9SS type A sorting domain-containing protein [Lutibacter sp. TH_r2]